VIFNEEKSDGVDTAIQHSRCRLILVILSLLHLVVTAESARIKPATLPHICFCTVARFLWPTVYIHQISLIYVATLALIFLIC